MAVQPAEVCYGAPVRGPALPCVAFLLAASLTQAALAVPITVRARTSLEVRASREPTGVALRGHLRDDRGRPVGAETVHVALTGFEVRAVRTFADGAFELTVRDDDLAAVEARHGARLAYAVRFEGDPDHGPASASGHVDLRRHTTWLDLTVDPAAVSIDADRLMVHIALHAESGPVAAAPVRVQVADGPELLGETDAQGLARFLIRPALLGAAGRYALRARFTGDHRFAPAEAATSFRVQLPTRLTLRVGREGDAATGRYRFSGRLIDGDGPLAGATVAILAGPVTADPGADDAPDAPRPWLVTTTDADGIYLAAVDARALFDAIDGALEVRAVFRPSDTLHVPAVSRPIVIPVPPPPGIPARWYLAGLLWVVGALAAAHVVRNRSWRALRLRWRFRRRRRPGADPVPALVDPPFVLGAASPADSARLDVVAGRVLDAHTQAPVPGLSVRLVGGDGQLLAGTTDAFGRFELGPAPPGSWRLDVTGADYLPRHLVTGLPHTGALDGATFAVVAIRRRVRDLYARALARAAGRLRWGHDTPAEALTTARADDDRLAEALVALERLTEHAWYAPHSLRAQDAEDASRLLEQIGVSAPGAARGSRP